MQLFYRLLPDHSVAPIDDLDEGVHYLATGDRNVAKTTLPDGRLLSTVFLALDHWGPFEDGITRRGVGPVLFETALLGDDHSCAIVARYRTWAEAEVGHLETMEQLLNLQARND